MKNRIPWIDIAKGIGIYLVILGHLYPGKQPAPALRDFIYYFHMPLFFFLGGCTFKAQDKLSVLLNKSFQGLVLPCLAWSLVFVFWHLTLFGDGTLTDRCLSTLNRVVQMFGDCIHERSLPCGPTWFLLALFWCRIALWLVLKLRRKEIAAVLWLIALVGVRHRGGLGYSVQ